MISFKANLVSNPEIVRKDENGNWNPYGVSFVKMDARDKSDTSAVGEVADAWANYCRKGEKTFAADVHRDMFLGANRDNFEFYALTDQKQNFGQLEHENILGFIQMRLHNGILHEIEYLQAHPSTYYTPKGSVYKGIGSTMIKEIIKLFPKMDIILMPVDSAKDFYKKMGFEQMPFTRKLKLVV